MTDRLPALLDCAGVARELGVKRATAERLMRRVPKIRIGRRVYVERAAVRDVLEKMRAA